MTDKIKIIVISDSTGTTASSVAKAAIAQFPNKIIYFTRYKNVRTKEKLDSIFFKAAKDHDIVIYTIVDFELRDYLCKLARKMKIKVIDVLGNVLTEFSNFFESSPMVKPGAIHEVNDQYFKRVAAMEFTLNHDDGRNVDSLQLADIVLVGVSRTSKTPLSIYLSLHGIKVVNIPLIYNREIDPQLFKIDQRKIFALTIDPDILYKVRKNRLKEFGPKRWPSDYASMEYIYKEVEWAESIFGKNKRWPVFNVTGIALEETASEIMKFMHLRKNNFFKQNQRYSL